MRRRSAKHAAEDREVAADRTEWKVSVGACMRCGCRRGLVWHEILRGIYKREAMKYRECCLLLCDISVDEGVFGAVCHPEVQDWPLAAQLALKLARDPWWFDLDKIRAVKGRGILVTMQDIRKAAIEYGVA